MGERANSRRNFLKEHPLCCYCGEPAATEDHCPPRCFFPKRRWPESYVFPACQPCNAQNRLDEQLLAVLVRINLKDDPNPENAAEWSCLVDGVRNNQFDVAKEWMSLSPSAIKKSFREAYGSAGDDLRFAGFGAIRLGPLSHGAITRFVIKLGQALYYKHCKKVLRGAVTFWFVNPIEMAASPQKAQTFFSTIPLIELPSSPDNSPGLTGML